MISIVIPLYNKEDFITETVQSVLNQTFTDYELLIVNDGSSDASMEAVNNFTDDRIRMISIENSGVSIARNTGIENAKYNWIAFLDADDWWAPTFLEEMYKAIGRNPEFNVFASGRSHVFKNRVNRYNNLLIPEDGKTESLNYFQVLGKYLPAINSSNAIIRKSVIIEAGNFKPFQKKHEDHDLWMRICIDEEIIFVNKNLSFYRKTEENTASKLLYEPSDLCIFLNTITLLKKKTSDNRKKYFERYCNKFVLFAYIKNYSRYSKNEDIEVYQLARNIVTGRHLLLLVLLKLIPFKNTYPIFNLFRVHGK